MAVLRGGHRLLLPAGSGRSITDHVRSELVVDALQMAIWNRRPAPGTVHHSDHGSIGKFNRWVCCTNW